ncbi:MULTISPECIES: DNA-processing protein DprA [Aliivibrio]|jgi:DNA processing protein|uniref:DNA protecting protein DprA n=1 Tax=Aliivibrio logei TaxID=688 RepID=A0A1B9NVZ7_ALILO|nr:MULTISPECIES: DNA-processing protein DprA [Aliivibrio]MBB1313201.1 DNA-protecting protein DprA [Aliivibrio sp. SR45-2]OCH18761.1 DNA protecting protein DprA [Aliivibrio logei]
MFNSDKHLSAWLTLCFCPRIGGKVMSRLLAIDSVENIVKYDKDKLQSIGLSCAQIAYIQAVNHEEVDKCLLWEDGDSLNTILTLSDPRYPKLLSEISAPPPVLFVKGDVLALSEPQVAIVGSRNASLEGLECAKQFAASIVQHNYVVTSGLALGVDGYAHHGAIEAKGQTIAVLGSGLNKVYPAKHRTLADRVIHNGALVSEFRPDSPPRADNFPRRNRIISGLSTGVLVVEAAERSGSLITARYANEQGREVFALPGSIHNPTAQGSNSLIKAGAKLVSSPEDIFEEIGALTYCAISHQPSLFEQEVVTEQLPFPKVFATVGIEATPVDIIAERCQTPVYEIMMQLLELELQGFITAVPGGYIKKRRG